MKNRLFNQRPLKLVTLTLTIMVISAVKLGICAPPPPPPPPPPAPDATAQAAAPSSAPATPDGSAQAAAPQTSAPDVPTSRFTKQDGAPELDETKRGFTDSGDRAIIGLFTQGNAAIQAMDTILTQMGNLYVDASRKFFDADSIIDTAYQQASFNLGILQQINQRTEEASKKPSAVAPSAVAKAMADRSELRRDAASPASPKPENGVGGKPTGAKTGQPQTGKHHLKGITPEQQASITEINKTLESIKQNKIAFNQLFSQINDTIGQGKSMASQARQKSLQILQVPNAAAGQGIIGEIQKLSQGLSQLFDQLQNTTVKNFNTTFDQLNTSAQAVNALIQKLQTKSFTLQVAQEQQQQKVDQQAQQQAATKEPKPIVSWFLPEKAPQTQAAGEPTVIHYAFRKAADALTYCIKMAYDGYVYGKDFVISKFGNQPAQPSTTAQAAKPGQPLAAPHQAPSTQQPPASVPPTSQPPAATPQQSTPPAPAGVAAQPSVPPTQAPASTPATTPPPAMPTAMPS